MQIIANAQNINYHICTKYLRTFLILAKGLIFFHYCKLEDHFVTISYMLVVTKFPRSQTYMLCPGKISRHKISPSQNFRVTIIYLAMSLTSNTVENRTDLFTGIVSNRFIFSGFSLIVAFKEPLTSNFRERLRYVYSVLFTVPAIYGTCCNKSPSSFTQRNRTFVNF